MEMTEYLMVALWCVCIALIAISAWDAIHYPYKPKAPEAPKPQKETWPKPSPEQLLTGWDLAKGDDVTVYRDAQGVPCSKERYDQLIAKKYNKQGAD